MKLYRIRRKTDGKYFMNFTCMSRGARFCISGQFCKKIDTVIKHVKNMCFDWEIRERPNGIGYAHYKIGKFPERIDLYEIVITDVTVNNETTIDAKDLIK